MDPNQNSYSPNQPTNPPAGGQFQPGAGQQPAGNAATPPVNNYPIPAPVPVEQPVPIPGLPTNNPAQANSTNAKLGPTTAQIIAKNKKMQIVLLVAIGLLAILTLVFGYRAFISQGQLDKSFAAGKKAGGEEQLKLDAEKIKDVSENPFRTYKSPDSTGAFEISFPKNWSLAVTPVGNGGELTGLLNPDYVDTKTEKYAMRFNLKLVAYSKTEDTYKKQMADSKGRIKSEEITVSDIKGIRYFGRFNKKDTVDKTFIILPVREKSLILQTDNNDVFLTDFNRVLSQAKIYP